MNEIVDAISSLDNIAAESEPHSLRNEDDIYQFYISVDCYKSCAMPIKIIIYVFIQSQKPIYRKPFTFGLLINAYTFFMYK